jgi:hypothetical protein
MSVTYAAIICMLDIIHYLRFFNIHNVSELAVFQSSGDGF